MPIMKPMEKKSNDTFCIVPFIHLSTAPLGTLRPCCFSSQYKVSDENNQPFNLGHHKLAQIWESPHYEDLRKEFLSGKAPKACEFCFKEESFGKRSKRQKENDKYSHYIDSVLENNKKRLAPKTLDLRLGNLCNLKCLSCNPLFSSPIEAEMKNQWPDHYFEKRDYENITYDNEWFSTKQFKENINLLLEELEFVYVSGGEPTINPSLLHFLKEAVDKRKASKIDLRFNTNLSHYNDEFYQLLPHFKSVDISISLDAIEKDLYLIRYPLQFKKVEENLEKLLLLSGEIEITFNCTTSLLNLFSLKDFYQWVDGKSQQHRRYFHISVDLVHEPTYLNLIYLHPSLRNQARAEIQDILSQVRLKSAAKKDLESLLPLIEPSENRELPEDYIHQWGKRAQFMKTMKDLRNIDLEQLEAMKIYE